MWVYKYALSTRVRAQSNRFSHVCTLVINATVPTNQKYTHAPNTHTNTHTRTHETFDRINKQGCHHQPVIHPHRHTDTHTHTHTQTCARARAQNHINKQINKYTNKRINEHFTLSINQAVTTHQRARICPGNKRRQRNQPWLRCLGFISGACSGDVVCVCVCVYV